MPTGDADTADATTAERWLPVAGWEEWYAVGSPGTIRRVPAGMGTPTGALHPTMHVNGSLCVLLCRPGRTQQVLVHHLVAAAFLGPCPAHHRLVWRNGIHTDNRATNLLYQRKRNAPLPLGTRRGPHSSLTDAQVREIRRLLVTTSGGAVARQFNVPPQTISRIKTGASYRNVPDEE